jgi:hypothetical protein
VATPSEELGAIVHRLERAADRLKADAGPPPERAPAPPVPPSAPAVPSMRERRIDEVLDGLERANIEVRRARERLADLERRIGLRG